MSNWGLNNLQVIEALTKHGEMTAYDIAKRTGLPITVVHVVCNRLSEATTYKPQRIHVCAWKREVLGKRNYPRPIYDVGDQPNVPKPKPKSHNKAMQEFRERRARVQWGRVTSVFSIGAVQI